MNFVRPIVVGETLQANIYTGRHRENVLPKGVGLFPLGDRDRGFMELGSDVMEERDSIDHYTKYLPY